MDFYFFRVFRLELGNRESGVMEVGLACWGRVVCSGKEFFGGLQAHTSIKSVLRSRKFVVRGVELGGGGWCEVRRSLSCFLVPTYGRDVQNSDGDGPFLD